MSARRLLTSALFATTCLLPATAWSQSCADCDRLITEIDARQGQQLPVSRQQVDGFIAAGDFPACQTALQQVTAQAQPLPKFQEGAQFTEVAGDEIAQFRAAQ